MMGEIKVDTILESLKELVIQVSVIYGGFVGGGAAVGAAAGGVATFFSAGGAAPSIPALAVGGAEAGLWLATVVMGILGLKELVVMFGKYMGEVCQHYSAGFALAWKEKRAVLAKAFHLC